MHQRHWTEHRLAELSCIDADCPIQAVLDRLAPRRSPHHVSESGKSEKLTERSIGTVDR